MLSASLDGFDLSKLRFPLLASPKLDGVRCLIINGVGYSRNMKPIRNGYVQALCEGIHGADGELIVGSPTYGNVLGRTQSGVMAYSGRPPVHFYLFDSFSTVAELSFLKRLAYAERAYLTTAGKQHPLYGVLPEFFKLVPHTLIHNVDELHAFEEDVLASGYEGVMLRDPYGPYKEGRSTLREGYLMKLKRFIDGEGVVVDLEEAMENMNELTRDELGRAKRSHAKDGLVPKGMVGTIVVRTEQYGLLRLSPGVMTVIERIDTWNDAKRFLGKTVHWRAFGYGMKDMPRFPRYYGVRDDI